MAEPAKVSVSRRIEAPAAVLFGILADPARHPEIDGAGMLRTPENPAPLTRAGDVFVMRMHNDIVGDYIMANHIVEFEAGRRITWEPEMTEVDDPEHQHRVGLRGHRWGYVLEPDDAATVVTATFDCGQAVEWLREATRNGENWIPAMTASLENLERIAVAPAGARPAEAGA